MTQEEFQQEAVRLRPMLLKAAKGYLHNDADSEDAVQTVLVRLWTMVDNVRSPMDGLAAVVLRHHCMDVIRQLVRTTTLDGHDQAEEKESEDYAAQLTRLISQLPPLQQTIVAPTHRQPVVCTDSRTVGHEGSDGKEEPQPCPTRIERHDIAKTSIQ